MLTLRLVWAWIKKYWAILLALTAFIVGYVLFRRSNVDIGSILDGINDDHRKDLESIKKKDEEIKSAKEQLQKEQEKKLQEVDKKYNDLEKELAESQKKRSEEILKETNSDPDKLAEELAKITGSKKLN